MIPSTRRFSRLASLAATLLLACLPVLAQAQQADLVVNQADSPDPGPAGGLFTYTIRVDNNGPDAAIGVTLTNTLPPGSVFDSVSTTQGGPCTHASGVVTCSNLGNLAFLANLTVTIRARLPAAGVWTNTATAGSSTFDPNTANNVNIIEDTTAQNAADMTLAIVDAPDPVAAGGAYSYALTARNNGPNALGGGDTQTIAFTVPTGACITSVPTGSGWSCTPNSGYPRCSGTISCTRTGALASGANAPVLTVPAVANVGGTITAAFQVSSSLLDGNPADNTVTADTTVTGGSADVAITKAASPTTVVQGSNVTYTLTPRFNGGEPPGTLAPNVITVTDNLVAGLTLTATPTGTGWSCTPNAGFPIAGPVTVTCTRPGPYTGGNFTNMPAITIVAQATGTGTIGNTATISAPETDPNPANNSGSVNIVSSNDADLSLAKTASLNPVVPNQPFNYTLTVRNNGPVAVQATNTITVTDTLPGGITLTGVPTGTGWTCTPNAGFPIAGPVVISCSRAGPLALNTNAPGITVPVVAAAAATYVNNACAALSGSGPVDNNAGNNCGSVSVLTSSTQADLRVVSKTASPNPVLAGQDLTYVITVDNQGPDPATNVTVTDTLASLIATGGFRSAAPSQGTCTPSGVTNGATVNLSCNLGTLNAGASATITVVVRPSIAASGNRTNTASVTSPQIGDPNRGNNTGSVTSAVTAVVDMTLGKTATPNPVRAGTPLTYVLSAFNAGPSTASNVVAIDTLPANAAFVQVVNVTAGSCVAPLAGTLGGTITCTWPVILANTLQNATYVVRPLTSAAGGNVVNNASVTTATLESDTTNNTTTSTTPVTPAQVDILVNKVDSVDPVALGQTTVYTVTTTNAGPSFATNVQLVDTFPTGSPTATFSYQGSLSVNPPGIGSCVEPAIGVTSGTLTCTFPGLANGASAIVTYAKRAESIASGVSGTTFNHAAVTAAEPETLPNNNQTTHATTSRRTADLAVVKTAPPSFTPGVAFPWTIVVTNNGPNDSVGATLTDVLPAGVTFQSVAPGAPACTHASGTVSCTFGTIANGGSTTVTINVVPSSPYTGATPLANTATVATVNEVDPVPGNNSSTATTTPGSAQVDLSLTKSGPASVLAGGTITWQIVIGNAGPSAGDGATFADTLPAGVTNVTASCGSPTGGAVCGPVSVAAGSVSGSVTTLPVGGTVTITIDANAPSSGPLVNTATVSPPPGGTETNPGNNTGSATTTVSPPDLTIVKVANGTFTQGQVGATYTITVSNVGLGPTSGTVSVTDTLPAGLTATAIAGSGWSCTLATLTCTRSDTLAPSASYPAITLTVNVAANAPSTLVNVANVSGGGETNLGNNQSSVTTPIGQLPDLTIVKVANGAFSLGQVGATYTITVTNVGPGPTAGVVTVTDTLPAGLTATAIAGTGWTCTLATLTCTRSDVLAPAASYPSITLTVNVSTTAPPSVVNVANVSGGGETNTGNNQSSVTTPLAPIPDLTIVKIANGTFTAGGAASYTLVVSNVGSVATSGTVTVTDTLPGALAATSVSGSGWTCTLVPVSCTRSDPLAPGASYPPITLAVSIAAGAPPSVVNTAIVAGGGEQNPSNNSGTVTTPMAPGGPPAEIPTLSALALALLALMLSAYGMRSMRTRRR